MIREYLTTKSKEYQCRYVVLGVYLAPGSPSGQRVEFIATLPDEVV